MIIHFTTVNWARLNVYIDIPRSVPIYCGKYFTTVNVSRVNKVKVGKTRKKAHVNICNKADICGILLSHGTSTALFLRCLQNMADITRTSIHRFVYSGIFLQTSVTQLLAESVQFYPKLLVPQKINFRDFQHSKTFFRSWQWMLKNRKELPATHILEYDIAQCG